MISNAGEYRFVTINDGLLINGGIMPLRNGVGVNSPNCLRGEDPAHLIEASSRIRAVLDHESSMEGEGGETQPMQIVDKHIYRSRFVNVIKQLKVIQPHVIKTTNGDLPIMWDCSNIKSSVVDIYGGYVMKSSEAEWGVGQGGEGGDEPGTSVGGLSLRKQPILNLFDDVHNMKTLNGNIPLEAGQLGGYDDWHIWYDPQQYPQGWGDTPSWMGSTSGQNIVASGILLFCSYGSVLANSWYEDGVFIGWKDPIKWVEKEYCYPSSGNFQFAMGGFGQWTQFVKKVWFGFKVRVCKYVQGWPRYDNVEPNVTTTTHKIYYPIEANWNAGSGEASVDIDKINAMTRDCLEHYGFTTGYTNDIVDPTTTYTAYLEYEDMNNGVPTGVEQVDVIFQVNDDCW